VKDYKRTFLMNDRKRQMGEIRGSVSPDLENRFRKLAMRKFGYGKGSLSKALEEALCFWINVSEK
jgi:hypothetical protein